MTESITKRKQFSPGRIVATPAALDALAANGVDGLDLLRRHLAGDWGEVDGEDAAANDAATRDGGRLLSAYKLSGDAKIWLITEADRSTTTLLLPEDY